MPKRALTNLDHNEANETTAASILTTTARLHAVVLTPKKTDGKGKGKGKDDTAGSPEGSPNKEPTYPTWP